MPGDRQTPRFQPTSTGFDAYGTVRGRPFDLHWRPPKTPEGSATISGDPLVVALVEEEAWALEDTPVGPVGGPFTLSRHRDHPLAVLELLHTHLAGDDVRVEHLDGDVPQPPEPPESAIP